MENNIAFTRRSLFVNRRTVALFAWMFIAPALHAGAAHAALAASPLDRRVALEEAASENPFVLLPHRPNYLLPLTYNDNPNSAPYTEGSPLNYWEAKYQISTKIPLAKDLVGGHTWIFFGYTQTSFWQTYTQANSAPFRETDYEPEFMLTFIHERDVLGFRSRLFTVGIDHQSNGQSAALSRSWNRVYTQFVLERGDFYLSFKPWWRIPEREKNSLTDTMGDDNPDIEKYMGNFELRAVHVRGRETFSMMLRNNLRVDENRGAVQFDYTYPIGKQVSGYVQLFNGYGESLIDYNHYTNRVGVGLMLTNWL